MIQNRTPDWYREDEYFTEGHHGTSLPNAQRIAEQGFDLDSFQTFFALPGEYDEAKGHGQKNALRDKAGQLAVISVTFPKTPIYYNDYGEFVVLQGEELSAVKLGSMAVFDATTMELLDKIALDELQ